jgi:predicted ATPase
MGASSTGDGAGLGRLSPGQGAEVARAAGGEALPEEAVGRILRRADGVPLYIEEMTRSVVETGNVVSDVEIPETLQASLLARLDRLGPEARELAQLAAVIGREFNAELLNAAARQPREFVGPALQRLVASQIVLPTGSAADGVYTFRHALIQDAAYQSLLLARRRQDHRNIAQALETQFSDTAESQPEIIAQHYTAAAEPELAIPYWLRAGNRAQARYAVLEQITYFERGLELARGLPEGLAAPVRSWTCFCRLAVRLTEPRDGRTLWQCTKKGRSLPASLVRRRIWLRPLWVWLPPSSGS